MTTPYTPANPLELGALQLDPGATKLVTSAPFGSPTIAGIQVSDSRTGNPNWTVSVQTNNFLNPGAHAFINGQNTGLTGLTAVTSPTGVLDAGDLRFTDIPPPVAPLAADAVGINGLGGEPHQIASTVNGGNGTIGFYGVFTLEAPTSSASGAYQGVIVFTIG